MNILNLVPSQTSKVAAAQSGTAETPALATGLWLESVTPSADTAVTLALIAMSLATVVAVATAFYLYRWRRIILAQPYLLSPEALATQVLSLERRIGDLGNTHAKDTERLEVGLIAVQGALERMIQTYMALQPKLDERDREIQQLRAGLEASLFKRFVRRFVRADLSLSDRIKEGNTGSESLQALSALLEDALAECGVERFSPATGVDYRRAEGVSDDPDPIPTEDESKAFQIAEVRRPGYRFSEGSGDRVVVPAEVAVFEFRAVTPQEAGAQ